MLVAMTFRQGSNAPADTPEDEYGLSLADVVGIIWRRLPIILLVAIVLASSVVGFSLMQTPIYEASTTIMIGEKKGKNALDEPLLNEVDGLQELTLVMAKALDSRRTAEATIRRLDLRTPAGAFVENLSSEQVAETPMIEITYEDDSPREAKLIVNTVAEVFPEQISDANVGTTGSITAKVWNRAVVPVDPVSPNPLRDGFVALVLGLMLGVGLAFLLEYLDDSWRSTDEVEQVSGVPTYALIPQRELPPAGRSLATRTLPSTRSLRSLSGNRELNGNKERR
jgi:capsular polysaccharide biosynthesis protein